MGTNRNEQESIHEAVRERYAGAALSVLEQEAGTADPCCGPDAAESCCEPKSAELEPDTARSLYSSIELDEVPTAASLASLGCGNPVAVAELRAGETVLDLGSGGGIDVLLSARRVGADGYAYGLDMTDEMLELARRNAAAAGAGNVEFLKGTIESVPLPDASVDVVISNCVVNLAADKAAVFAEIARVLRPGGRDRHHRYRGRGSRDGGPARGARLVRGLHRRSAVDVGVPCRSRVGRTRRGRGSRHPRSGRGDAQRDHPRHQALRVVHLPGPPSHRRVHTTTEAPHQRRSPGPAWPGAFLLRADLRDAFACVHA